MKQLGKLRNSVAMQNLFQYCTTMKRKYFPRKIDATLFPVLTGVPKIVHYEIIIILYDMVQYREVTPISPPCGFVQNGSYQVIGPRLNHSLHLARTGTKMVRWVLHLLECTANALHMLCFAHAALSTRADASQNLAAP